MKFNLGDEVVIRATGKIGKIGHCKNEKYFVKGKLKIINSYGVIFSPYYTTGWFYEAALSYPLEVDPEFDEELLNLMIDINLENRNFDMVKNYSDIKYDLLK
jgi:hypothetical protein